MRFVIFLAGLAMALAAGAARAAEMRLGSLTLDWPAGYSLKTTQSPFQLDGPEGSKVEVTVMAPNPSATGPESKAQLQRAVERMLVVNAQGAGSQVVALTRETLSDGTALQFIVSDTSKPFRPPSYLLQYVLTSTGGDIAFLSFKGNGSAQAEHQAARRLVREVRWNVGDAGFVERLAFTQRVAAQLQERVGGKVGVAEPLQLTVGKLTFELGDVYARCTAAAKACDSEINRHLDSVADSARAELHALLKAAIRVLVRKAPLADAGAQTQPFIDGLVTQVVVASPTGMRPLTEADRKTLGLTPAQAHEVGLANLRATLLPLAEVATPVKRGTVASVGEADYAASRLLLLQDWAPLARAQGGTLIVSAPTPEVLLYGADDSARGVAALRVMGEAAARHAPSRLYEPLLRWTETGWKPLR